MSILFVAYIAQQRAWPFLCIKDANVNQSFSVIHVETVTGPVATEGRRPTPGQGF